MVEIYLYLIQPKIIGLILDKILIYV